MLKRRYRRWVVFHGQKRYKKYPPFPQCGSLYPIYWAVLLLTILLSIAASIASGGHSLGKAQAYLTYYDQLSIGSFLFLILTNIGLFLQDTVLFLGLDQITGNLFFTENFRLCKPVVSNFLLVPQAWTIGIELTFYLIAPFIVRRRLSSILLWIVASLSFRIILYYRGLDFDRSAPAPEWPDTGRPCFPWWR